MQVAIYASRYLLGIRQEDGLWLLARLQLMAKHIGRGEQLYPLDVMLWQHRMLCASYLYTIAALDGFYHGHMLLLGTIRGVLFHLLHRLTATTQHGTRIYYFHYVATYRATIDFSCLCHNRSSSRKVKMMIA